MVSDLRNIVIDGEAKLALKEAYKFIKKDSFQNAKKSEPVF